jgi:hypothetical protein
MNIMIYSMNYKRRNYMKKFVLGLLFCLVFILSSVFTYGASIYNEIQLKRDTAANWTLLNPVLKQGEPGFEYDANRMKIGDGLTHWVNLPYLGNIYGSSTTSLTIGTGSKTLTVPAGLSFIQGMVVEITYATDVSKYMLGTVTSYNIATGVLVVNVTNISSSGTSLTPWVVWVSSGPAGAKGDKGDTGDKGDMGVAGPTGATGPAGADALSLYSTRQTVFSSAIDTDGNPNFISIGTGLSTNIAATTTPFYVAFAHGFSANGYVDYVHGFTSDTTIDTLTPFATNYLYANKASSVYTLSKTPYKPLYKYVYTNGKEQGAILANFDSTNDATTFTDTYNNVWTGRTTTGVISTAQYKFGTASAYVPYNSAATYGWSTTLPNNFTNTPWTIEFWYRPTQTGGNNNVVIDGLTSASNYSFRIIRNTSNYLSLFLSSNGTTWNIASDSAGSIALAKDTWYHVAFQWDGATYKLFVDGVLDASVTSSTALSTANSTLYLGSGYSLVSDGGYFDDFRMTPYARHNASLTPPTSIYLPDTMYYFSINDMKMYSGCYGNWTNVDTVFIGEAVTNLTTVTNVINYALNGINKLTQTTLTQYTAHILNHNIGTDNVMILSPYIINKVPQFGYEIGDKISMRDMFYPVGADGTALTLVGNNKLYVTVSGYIGYGINRNTGIMDGYFITANWSFEVTIKRGF